MMMKGLLLATFVLNFGLISLYSQTSARLWIGTVAAEPDSVVSAPIQVSTDSSISLAQVVIEFDSTIVVPAAQLAEIGASVPGLNITNVNMNLPFPPVSSGTNKNLLVQLSGSGSATFSGDSLELLKINFQIVGTYKNMSPLHFDQTGGRTFLSTVNLNDLQGESIEFQSGGVSVIDLTPPSPFDLVEPPDNSWTNEKLPLFSWQSASDATSGLAYYQLFINSDLTVDGIPRTQTNTVPPSLLEDGEYLWKVVAVDSAKNQRESHSTWLLQVDSSTPVSQITQPQPGEEVSGTIIIRGTANDGSGIGVDSVLVSTDDGSTWQLATGSNGNFVDWEYQWDITQDGPITILTQGIDKLGNRETPHGTTVTEIEENHRIQVPSNFGLAQNYPNPFNPGTTIPYQLPMSTRVNLTIYNLMGQKIVTLVEDKKVAGFFTVSWNGKNSFGNQVASGIYLVKIQAGPFIASRKLILMR